MQQNHSTGTVDFILWKEAFFLADLKTKQNLPQFSYLFFKNTVLFQLSQRFPLACPSAAIRLNFDPSVVPTGTGRPDPLKLILPPEDGVARRSLSADVLTSWDSAPLAANDNLTGRRWSFPRPEWPLDASDRLDR